MIESANHMSPVPDSNIRAPACAHGLFKSSGPSLSPRGILQDSGPAACPMDNSKIRVTQPVSMAYLKIRSPAGPMADLKMQAPACPPWQIQYSGLRLSPLADSKIRAPACPMDDSKIRAPNCPQWLIQRFGLKAVLRGKFIIRAPQADQFWI